MFLGKDAKADVGSEVVGAAPGLKLPCDDAQEGGFACAVGADEGDAFAVPEVKR